MSRLMKSELLFILGLIIGIWLINYLFAKFQLSLDFEMILFWATVVTGLIYVFDRVYATPRRAPNQKPSFVLEFGRSTFVVFLLVFVLRTFIAEPFRIPSKSLVPSLWPGEFILVNKFIYGIKWPLTHRQIIDIKQPKRGDIVVFRWPPEPAIFYVKRVIGLPGDTISYVDKRLTINGKVVPQQLVKGTLDDDATGHVWPVNEYREALPGQTHLLYRRPQIPAKTMKNIVVPQGQYFMMGDNRDSSNDSRYWGFVPSQNIVGKAFLVWLSWDSLRWRIRWRHLGLINA